ncbi:MAG TPA: sigma-70 family RNA polymerase sigma factor [Candidatus Eubacterium faecipullorum]|uniref:Sigma-70 family RNA polymerase sigma factor n=1 Tax=Candidatus Eubacterium faecipullorum TaxID=2838571 RepID=A0A9D1RGW0_9FIRM|nr:sigma-70 family RNA polymerase sigma factor [Candidatus Eubacterium faecipullorum]
MVKERRNQMIEENIGLVHSIAKRFTGRGVDYEDLFQTGCIGLIKAVDNFDESKGFRFSTYAVPVIMGEIRRIFRDGGAIKVSRALKEKSVKAQRLRELFAKKELREPTLSELSDMLGCEADETAEILNVINPMLSLNSFGEDGNELLDVPVDNREELFEHISLLQGMEKLSPEERFIIDSRYYKGKTQSETASALGVSQVQISRKEKEILKKLRIMLK